MSATVCPFWIINCSSKGQFGAVSWLLPPEPVPPLPPDLSPEMPPEPPPEPPPDPVPPWAARLLLAEALDLLRDGGAQGWLRAELDDFGLELALHPLGADWPAVLARLQDDADERRRLLDDALRPLLGAVPA